MFLAFNSEYKYERKTLRFFTEWVSARFLWSLFNEKRPAYFLHTILKTKLTCQKIFLKCVWIVWQNISLEYL